MEKTNFKMSEKESLELDAMIRKIAMKKKHTYETSSLLNYEDMVQELWINALEIINRLQRIDMNLIAVASYQKIVDLIRKDCRRPSVAIDPNAYEYNDDAETSNSNFAFISSELNHKFESPSEFVEVEEILDLFEKDSKPRKFVELLIGYFCNFDEKLVDTSKLDFSDLIGKKDNYWNTWVARQLGYVGSTSSGYQKVRWQVRNALEEAGYSVGK